MKKNLPESTLQIIHIILNTYNKECRNYLSSHYIRRQIIYQYIHSTRIASIERNCSLINHITENIPNLLCNTESTYITKLNLYNKNIHAAEHLYETLILNINYLLPIKLRLYNVHNYKHTSCEVSLKACEHTSCGDYKCKVYINT